MFNRNWLIIGVATGFGRIMAGKLLAHGARVVGTVETKDRFAELRQSYGERLWLTCLDLADRETIRDGIDEAFWELGRIDVAIDFFASRDVQRAVEVHLHRQGHGRILHVSGADGGGAPDPAQPLPMIAPELIAPLTLSGMSKL